MPGTSNSLRILGVLQTEGDKGVTLLVGKKIIPLHTPGYGSEVKLIVNLFVLFPNQ